MSVPPDADLVPQIAYDQFVICKSYTHRRLHDESSGDQRVAARGFHQIID